MSYIGYSNIYLSGISMPQENIVNMDENPAHLRIKVGLQAGDLTKLNEANKELVKIKEILENEQLSEKDANLEEQNKLQEKIYKLLGEKNKILEELGRMKEYKEESNKLKKQQSQLKNDLIQKEETNNNHKKNLDNLQKKLSKLSKKRFLRDVLVFALGGIILPAIYSYRYSIAAFIQNLSSSSVL